LSKINCASCGGLTNSFLYHHYRGVCYAKVVNGVWVEGCIAAEYGRCVDAEYFRCVQDLLGKPVSDPIYDVNSVCKVVCRWCGWRGYSYNILRAPNPFVPNGDLCVACPDCKEIGFHDGALTIACDAPGCFRSVSAGTPIQHGYRHTCSDHRPVKSEEQDADVFTSQSSQDRGNLNASDQ
jgi:hypothetical protein